MRSKLKATRGQVARVAAADMTKAGSSHLEPCQHHSCHQVPVKRAREVMASEILAYGTAVVVE